MPTLTRRTERWLVRVAYLVPFSLFLVEETVLLRGAFDQTAPYLLYSGILEDLGYFKARFVVFLGSFVVSGFLLLRASLMTSGRERNQVRWVVWSVLTVAVADSVLVFASYWFTGAYSDTALGPVRNALYLILGAGLLIAILKDDLFDVDRVIWASALYFMATGAVFVLFAVLEEALSAILGRFFASSSTFAATAVSGIVAAAAFQPVRRGVDRILSRFGLNRPDNSAPDAAPS